jgi:hypothetical protein
MRDQKTKRRIFRSIVLLAVAGFAAGAPQRASGQAPAEKGDPAEKRVAAEKRDPAAAEALFQEGRRLIKSGAFHPACAKFEESFRLDPAAGTLANLADCEETLGRTASAWQHWRQASDLMVKKDPRRRHALQRAALLEKLVPTLQIALEPGVPASSQVKRDGVTLGQASLGVPLPADPGHHVIHVSAPGRETSRFDLILVEGEKRVQLVAPGEPELPPPPWRAPTPRKTDAAVTERRPEKEKA